MTPSHTMSFQRARSTRASVTQSPPEIEIAVLTRAEARLR